MSRNYVFNTGSGISLCMTSNQNVGFHTVNPSERLEFADGNAKFDSNIYVMKRVGVNMSNPLVELDIDGSAHLTKDFTVDGNINIHNPITVNGFYVTKNSNYVLSTAISAAVNNIDVSTTGTIFSLTNISDNFRFVVTSNLNDILVIPGVGAVNLYRNMNITGDIIPNSNILYNLGSATNRFKDLYLSGNTINMDGVNISKDAVTGNIQFMNQATSNMIPLVVKEVQFKDGDKVFMIKYDSNVNKMKFVSYSNNKETEDVCIPNVFTSNSFIGIGTSNPKALLHVANDAILNVARVGSYPSDNTYAMFSHCNISTPSSYALLQHSGGDTYINAASTKAIRLRINNNDAVIVDTSGRLGVGTTTPTYTGDVSGSFRVTGSSVFGTADNSTLTIYGNTLGFVKKSGTAAVLGYGNSNSFKISMLGQSDITTSISSATITDRLTIDTSGNVGINTTSPAFKLHNALGSVFIGDISYSSSTIPSTSSHLSTANGHRLVFDNSYNGSAGSGIAANKIVLYNNNSLYGFGMENAALTYHSAANHTFYTGANNTSYGTAVMMLNSSGYLGVGTTLPTYMLDVVGQGRIAGNVVTQTSNVLGSSNYTIWGAPIPTSSVTNSNNVSLMISGGMTYPGVNPGVSTWANGVVIFKGGDVGGGLTGWGNSTSYYGADAIIAGGNVSIGANNNGSAPVYGYGGNVKFYPGWSATRTNLYGTPVNSGGQTIFYYATTNGGTVANLGFNSYGDPTSFYTGAFTSNVYAEAMRISSVGNVGIGTSSPGSLLDVSSATSAYIRVISTSNATNANLSFVTTGGYHTMYREALTNNFKISNGSSDVMTISNVHVGVGITPQQRLHIGGVSGVDTYLRIDAGGISSNYSGIMLSEYNTNYGHYIRYNAATDYMEYGYNNTSSLTTYMVSSTLGYLGIGTTSPLAKLTVRNLYNEGTSGGFCIDATDGAVYNLRLSSYVQNGGQVGYKFTVNNSTLTNDSLCIGYNGNIGIGTSNPNYSLHVLNKVQVQGTFGNAYTSAASHGRIYFNDTNFGIGCGTFTSSPVDDNLYLWAYDGTGRDIVFCHTNNGSTSASNFTKDMIIKGGTGYVGIGNTSPSYRLDVNGEICTNQNNLIVSTGVTTAGSYGIYWNGNSDTSYAIYRSSGSWSGDFQQLVLNWQTGIILSPGVSWGKSYVDIQGGGLRVTSGNVGIGTTSPSYKLHVTGDIYANGGYVRVSGNNGLYFESWGGGWYMSDSSWIRAFNNKNIYTPGEIQSGVIRAASGTSGGYYFTDNPGGGGGDSAWMKYYSRSGESCTLEIGISNDADDHIYLNPSGNVGVGTTSPSYKLHVTGDIYANGDWLRVSGYGLYNNTSGSSFYKNDTYYGSWRIDSGGVQNNWSGIRFTQQEVNLMCGNNTDRSCGFHWNNVGWALYVDSSRSLYVPGDITAYWSDRRLKENLTVISDFDNVLRSLTGYRFTWNEKGQKILTKSSDEIEVGLIAQDVQAVIPQAVKVNKAGIPIDDGDSFDYLSINYDKIIPFLVEGYKAQVSRLEIVEEENKFLRSRLDRLEKILNII